MTTDSIDNLKNLTDDQLEKMRTDTIIELQELDADFTMMAADTKGKTTKNDLEWRAQAVEDKKNICNLLRHIKAEIKIRNNKSGSNLQICQVLKDMVDKMDRIIFLIERQMERGCDD